jgi:hypothetical protein
MNFISSFAQRLYGNYVCTRYVPLFVSHNIQYSKYYSNILIVLEVGGTNIERWIFFRTDPWILNTTSIYLEVLCTIKLYIFLSGV